jgi:hypothetical protein
MELEHVHDVRGKAMAVSPLSPNVPRGVIWLLQECYSGVTGVTIFPRLSQGRYMGCFTSVPVCARNHSSHPSFVNAITVTLRYHNHYSLAP